jgi:lysophospholipase L1-like esterase
MTLAFCGFYFAATAATVHAATPPADANIRYFGRWDRTNTAEYVSQWAGPYLKVGFTGRNVAALLGEKEPSSFYARVDDGPVVEFSDKTGAVDLTPAGGLKAGAHQLFVIAHVGKPLRFRGLELDRGARTAAPRLNPRTVLFVGDSITFGASATNPTLAAWAPKAARESGSEFVRVAQGGIGLVDGFDAPIGKRGMEKQFFQLGAFGTPLGFTPFVGFRDENPDVIVVNLGTNDGNKNEKNPAPMDVFRDRYASFLGELRKTYLASTILALELFNRNGAKNDAIRQAVAKHTETAKDQNVHCVSTDGWVNPNPAGGDIAPDWSHPTDQGHAKLAARMTEVLRNHSIRKETKR